MSKELESLERVGNNLEHHYPENIKDFNILKQALQRLENQDDVIENCIRCLEADMPKSAITLLYALRDRKRVNEK